MNYLAYIGGTAVAFTLPFAIPILVLLVLWELLWKGIALWKCGRNNQMAWFVAILIINSIGILPIIYMLFFQKKEIAKKRR